MLDKCYRNAVKTRTAEEFAASDNYGMIFTYMWALDVPHEWDYVAHVADIFARQGADIYYADA